MNQERNWTCRTGEPAAECPELCLQGGILCHSFSLFLVLRVLHPSCSEYPELPLAVVSTRFGPVELLPCPCWPRDAGTGPGRAGGAVSSAEQEGTAAAQCRCSSVTPGRLPAAWLGAQPSWQRLVLVGRGGFSFSIFRLSSLRFWPFMLFLSLIRRCLPQLVLCSKPACTDSICCGHC